MRRYVLYLLLPCCVSQLAVGGVWPRKQGAGFVQLGFSTIQYDRVYGDDSKKASAGADVTDNVLQIFAEYGLTNKLTLQVMVPFKFLSVSPHTANLPKITRQGVGDIDVALRRNWYNLDGYAVSTEIGVGLPTGSTSNAAGLYTGDGETNVAIRILGGRSFYPLPLYISADVAFNIRSMHYSHDVFYNLEVGYGFLESRLYVILLLSGRESTSNRPTFSRQTSLSDMSAASFGFYTNNQEYTAFIPKILYKFTNKWGAVLSYGTATHGRNIAGGAVIAGGVFYEF